MGTFIDLTGRVYGDLKILQFVEFGKNGSIWKCRCSCGTEVEKRLQNIKKTSHCGCKNKSQSAYFFIGKKYGDLTVIQEIERKKNKRFFLCHCKCGNLHTVQLYQLTSGKCTNCGCVRKKIIKESSTKHGMSNTRIYNTYRSMKSRCNNKNNKDYKNYGGRGIKISEEFNSPQKFIHWALNNGYDDKLTLERIDVNKDYSPDNCCFIKNEQQANNRQNTIWIELDGEMIPLSLFCKNNNLSYHKVWKMLFRNAEQKYQKNGDTCINLKTLVFQKGLDEIRKSIIQDRTDKPQMLGLFSEIQ